MIFVTPYSCMSAPELAREYALVLDEYDQLKAQGLKLNMASWRASPAPEPTGPTFWTVSRSRSSWAAWPA